MHTQFVNVCSISSRSNATPQPGYENDLHETFIYLSISFILHVYFLFFSFQSSSYILLRNLPHLHSSFTCILCVLCLCVCVCDSYIFLCAFKYVEHNIQRNVKQVIRLFVVVFVHGCFWFYVAYFLLDAPFDPLTLAASSSPQHFSFFMIHNVHFTLCVFHDFFPPFVLCVCVCAVYAFLSTFAKN